MRPIPAGSKAGQMPPKKVPTKNSWWKLCDLSAKDLSRKVWQGINDDDVWGRSAQLAYYFFFALFPLAICLTAVLGLIVGSSSRTAQNLIDYLTRAMPPSAVALVHQTMHTALTASGGGKITFGLLLALFFASSGLSALMDTLNVVFGVRERRSLLRQRIVALLLTLIVGGLICLAVLLVVIGDHIANTLDVTALKWTWKAVEYPVAVLFLLFAYSLIYYYAPDLRHRQRRWLTLGSVIGVSLWILASFGLRVYLHFFNSYTVTYGALGAVMTLLLWFYVTGFSMLVGGEINAIIDKTRDS
jgi:membrane protein